MVSKGRLIKAGYGIYTRARPSAIDGNPTPAKGLRELAREALGRVGVETAPTRMEQDYNAGRTTQVPTGRVIGVRGRLRRQISITVFPWIMNVLDVAGRLRFDQAAERRPPGERRDDRQGNWICRRDPAPSSVSNRMAQ